jgi:type II secretion system protein G
MILPSSTDENAPLVIGNKTHKGLTLIELLIVVAIIAILAGLTLSTMGYVNKKGARSRAEAEIAALSAAIESYKLEFGTYPTNQTVLFRELVGTGTINSNRVLFEPRPGMTTNMTNGPFIDPWGAAYSYTTNATVNLGFFDLWTQAGETASNTNNWIRN